MIHRVKGFGIVNKAEIDVFLELSCFFDDPVDVGNLISGSSAFSKSSLNIWKFTVHVLLKPGLENFEFILLVCEMSAIVQSFEHPLALPFFGIRMKTDLSCLVATAEFFKFVGVLNECITQQHHFLRFEMAQLEFHHFL